MKISQIPYRVYAWLLWCVPTLVSLYGAGRMYGDHAPWSDFLLLLIFPLGGGVLAAPLLYLSPRLELQEDGLYVKRWFVNRFYFWNDFCQAGASCFINRNRPINVLVLVKKGCSKRKYRDHLFHFRNFGRLVYIPYTSEAKAFVIAHYGPLDFNVAYGNVEESTVVDVPRDTISDW